MLDSEPVASGLLGSMRRFLETGVAALQTRFELLLVELQEEKQHALELAIWVIAVLFFAVTTALVLTATIVLIFPDHLRPYVSGAFALLYLAGGVWAAARLKQRLKTRGLPFEATLDEMKKDREWLLK